MPKNDRYSPSSFKPRKYKPLRYVICIYCLLVCFSSKAQYRFSGHVDNLHWSGSVYLSVVEDYRKISGIYLEQVISKVSADSLGYFEFTGNQLEHENRIYRIHVDNCFNEAENHFNGKCNESKAVTFIAKNNDTIVLPFTFDQQMFCDIKSTNPKATAFARIDSLREEMKYAYSEFRSEANRKLNNKKWFNTFQTFGEKLNEPIAELYIYSFLSNRSNDLHEYYLNDLKNSTYYNHLKNRLKTEYPQAPFTKQYEEELASDEFIVGKAKNDISAWHYFVYILLVLSLVANIWFLLKRKNKPQKTDVNIETLLTKQEQNILNLLLGEKSNKEIADALFISLSTVKTHVNNIYKKLSVQSREEAKALFNK
ncbi:MAG: response regulator transcription factor [Flavobacteriaceae bacterium]